MCGGGGGVGTGRDSNLACSFNDNFFYFIVFVSLL